MIKTASWFTQLPADHQRIGISRSAPRRMEAGYRMFKALCPGDWFASVPPEEYYRRYQAEILARLDPKAVAAELHRLSGALTPTLLCYEKPGGGDWCHRAMVAEWLSEALGEAVPEFGHEALPQDRHPLMPAGLARKPAGLPAIDLTPFIGRSVMLAGEEHRVVGPDPAKPGRALVTVGERTFSTCADTLVRHFA